MLVTHLVPLCAPFPYEMKNLQGSEDSGTLSILGSLIVSLSPAPLRFLLFLILPIHAQDFLADEMTIASWSSRNENQEPEVSLAAL